MRVQLVGLVFVALALPGCADADGGEAVTEADLRNMVRNGKGAVIGKLLDHNNQPMYEILVKVHERQSGAMYCQVKTSPDGRFYCGQLNPGSYYVWINLKDWKNVNAPVYAGKFTNLTIDQAHYGPGS